MTSSPPHPVTVAAPPGRRGSMAVAASASVRTLALLWPTFLVCAASIVCQVYMGTTTDVSWLITLGERILDGQTAYVDFLEVNPPASIFLYVPAVAIARMFSVAPEFTVKASVYLLFFASMLLCHAIDAPGRNAGAKRHLELPVYAVIFLLLPGGDFGQREHFIALALLPVISGFVQRAQGASVSLFSATLAGVMAGAAIALKPYFTLAILLPWGSVLWSMRHSSGAVLRCLIAPELVAAAGVAILYLIVAGIGFPSFFVAMLPLVLDLYVVFRCSPGELLTSASFLIWAATVIAALYLAPERRSTPRLAIPLLASLGCLAAWLIQGKSWSYQGYPAVALALTALADVAASRWQGAPIRQETAPRPHGWVALVALVVLLSRSFVWYSPDIGMMAPLRAAMARLKPHPTMMAVAPMLRVGHPLVRELGGTWVGHLSSTWIFGAATILGQEGHVSVEQRRRFVDYMKLEKDMTASDIVRFRPDYILVAKEFSADDPRDRPDLYKENWIKSTPQLVRAFSAYAPIDDVAMPEGRVIIWGRR